MLLCRKHKLAIVAPPKTGSRALWKALEKRFGDELEATHAIQILPPSAERDRALANFEWICSVRNPYLRVVSWYFYKRFWSLRIRDMLPETEHTVPRAWLEEADHMEIAMGPNPYDWANKSLPDCLQDEDNRDYMRKSLSLARYQRRLPIDRLTLVRQEHLEADVQAAHPSLTGMPVPFVEVNHRKPYSRDNWEQYYDEATITLVQRVFSQDFEWLSSLYTREFPGTI